MSKEGFKSARNKTVSPVQVRGAPPTFKDRVESMSGLVGSKQISWACNFMSNAANGGDKRLSIIKAMKEATLIPDTYDKLMGTLSRLAKTDLNPEIQSAALETFNFLREKQLTVYRFKKVV